jgi:tryptophanase
MGSRSVRLTAVLRDTENNPIRGKTISFQYRLAGSSTWLNAGTATTDSNGVASIDITVSAPNKYDFKAYFAGDDQYESAEATVTNYTIKGKPYITLTVTQL